MKNEYLFVLVLILLSIIPGVYAEETLSNQAAFCEHMGYNISINITENIPYCIFNDGSKCTLDNFYNKTCSPDKIKNITRTDGESVYLEFEKCDIGLLISEPKYLLDTYHCYKPGFLDNLNMFFKNLFGKQSP